MCKKNLKKVINAIDEIINLTDAECEKLESYFKKEENLKEEEDKGKFGYEVHDGTIYFYFGDE